MEDNMRIYITHCSAKKDKRLRNSDIEVTPDKLYTSTKTQCFMNECKKKNVKWAIFSDLYGVWFPEEKHKWYEKSPDTVSEQEFKSLLSDFDQRLQHYDEIWFYYNPGRFHPLYKILLKQSKLKDKVHLFTHKIEIT